MALPVTAAAAAAVGLVTCWAWATPTPRQETVQALAYQQSLTFQYEARVQPTSIYPGTTVTAADLMPCSVAGRSGGEPSCRRLATSVTESLAIRVRYGLTLDMPASMAGTIRWTAAVGAPGYWERPLPVWTTRQVSGSGPTLSATEELTLRMADIFDIMDSVKNETDLPAEQVELHIRPEFALLVEVAGHRLSPAPPGELVIRLAGRKTADIPDKLTFTESKAIQEIRKVPVTIGFRGREYPLQSIRQWLSATEAGILYVLLILLRSRRRGWAGRGLAMAPVRALTVAETRVPPQCPVVLVPSARELKQLAARVDRPVMFDQRERAYVLFDGAVCYKLSSRAPEN